ncbi:hypothetical protein ADA01nite_36600 [Aneurinibacillus danicus]|uniref:UDP-glucose 4-epimerase n=2 Tax=Aneurinibacillus danicus TaxID=267746 RepID=A0A511VB94_9BACL|nr:hypothetical protein ADA01nite_36600 [Aneurinibacillus danicus]
MCEQVTGRKARVEHEMRKTGDPARLVASSAKIKQKLGWEATYDLEAIIQTAWKWHSNHPHGYTAK